MHTSVFSIPFLILIHNLLIYNCNSQTTTTSKPLFPKSTPLPIVNSTKFSIPDGYKKENRPTSSNSEPTLVWFDIHVVAINPIKAADMDFRMDMTLSQRWTDNRLKFSSEWFHDNREFFILPFEFIDQIWHPDPYIVNAKSTDVGQLTQKLVTVYIYRNQTVHYVANLFATVACAMNYRFYPFDHQVCPMFIESFSYDETQVKYRWVHEDAFTINLKLRMLQFVVTRPLHYREASVPRYLEDVLLYFTLSVMCPRLPLQVKNFSQLIACFRFDRLLGNHLIQTFSPCSLIVCLSWFSFWLELNALSARMSLVVTSILTLVTQFVGLKADLPPVAYIKAVDVWMAGCMIWVFGALGEYVLVKVIYSVTEDVKFHHAEDIRLGRAKANGTYKTSGIIYHNESPEEGQPPTGNPDFTPLPQNGTRRRATTLVGRPNSALSILENNDMFRSRSPSMSSMNLDMSCGKLRIPLQWTDPQSGKTILLWKKIDNACKWLFPLTFFLFCGFYWLLLYIHSRATMIIPFLPLVHINMTSCTE